MAIKNEDCVIDSLQNSDRVPIVFLSNIRAKFANGQNGAKQEYKKRYILKTIKDIFSARVRYIYHPKML